MTKNKRPKIGLALGSGGEKRSGESESGQKFIFPHTSFLFATPSL